VCKDQSEKSKDYQVRNSVAERPVRKRKQRRDEPHRRRGEQQQRSPGCDNVLFRRAKLRGAENPVGSERDGQHVNAAQADDGEAHHGEGGDQNASRERARIEQCAKHDLLNSVTEAELHREFLFTILEVGQIAMLPHNRLIAESQRQMRSGDYQQSSNHVLATLLNPRFNGNRERGHYWKECEVFEHCECQIRLTARRLASESNNGDVEKQHVSEQKAHAESNNYLRGG